MTHFKNQKFLLGIVTIFFLIVCVSQSAEDSTFQQPSLSQFKQLFDALTKKFPDNVRVMAFSTIKTPVETEEQMLASAKLEQEAFKNELGREKTQAEIENEIKNIVDKKREENTGIHYFLEKETTIKDACRLNQTDYDSKKLPQIPADLQKFAASETNKFSRTVVWDKTKGEFYHFEIYWRLGSSYYDTRPGSAPVMRGLFQAMHLNFAVALSFLPIMCDSNQVLPTYDQNTLLSFLNNANPRYKIFTRSTQWNGITVDQFRIQKNSNSNSLVAEFIFNKTNYNRLYESKVYNAKGEIIENQEKENFDENDFPRFWKTGKLNSNSKWIEETRTYLSVEFPEQIDRNAIFGFNPPDKFEIENHSSGQTVIERYPMIAGKRLGPKDVVWDQGEPKHVFGISESDLIRRVFLVILIGSSIWPLFLIFRRKPTNNSTNQKQ